MKFNFENTGLIRTKKWVRGNSIKLGVFFASLLAMTGKVEAQNNSTTPEPASGKNFGVGTEQVGSYDYQGAGPAVAVSLEYGSGTEKALEGGAGDDPNLEKYFDEGKITADEMRSFIKGKDSLSIEINSKAQYFLNTAVQLSIEKAIEQDFPEGYFNVSQTLERIDGLITGDYMVSLDMGLMENALRADSSLIKSDALAYFCFNYFSSVEKQKLALANIRDQMDNEAGAILPDLSQLLDSGFVTSGQVKDLITQIKKLYPVEKIDAKGNKIIAYERPIIETTFSIKEKIEASKYGKLFAYGVFYDWLDSQGLDHKEIIKKIVSNSVDFSSDKDLEDVASFVQDKKEYEAVVSWLRGMHESFKIPDNKYKEGEQKMDEATGEEVGGGVKIPESVIPFLRENPGMAYNTLNGLGGSFDDMLSMVEAFK